MLRTNLSPRQLVAALVVVAGVALSAPAGAWAGEPDQSQTAPPNGAVIISGQGWAAQTFTAGIAGRLDQVDLLLRRGGNPGDLTVQIRDTSGGAPGASVLASETIAQASIPDTGFTWRSVAFDPTAPSAAGTQYAIVLFAGTGSGIIDPSNAYLWGANGNNTAGDLYPGGELRSSLAGFSWLPLGADGAFKTYVAPADARRVARRLGVEGQLVAASRRVLPPHVRSDIRDRERLVGLLEALLTPDSDCLDVGAHEGAVLREMVRVAPGGRHVAWEPLPAFARRLRSRFPTVEIRQAALSDSAGERAFTHVLGDPGWSGFRARPTPRGGPTQTITVRCERLDDALPGGVSPALIKIDVEGAEEEVLLGARETLRRHRPVVVFEHGCGSADHYGSTPNRIHGLFTGSLGYQIHGLDWDGPYTAERFAEIFASGERVNFVAVPRG